MEKVYTATVDLFRLANEINESINDLEYIKDNGDGTVSLFFTDDLTAQETTDLDAIVSGHTPTVTSQPKIYDYTVSSDDHRVLNYTTGLLKKLFPARTFVQGELQKVEWYAEESQTDLILTVDIVYNRDTQGFAVDRTTTRTWKNKDGSDNDKNKVTKKVYDTPGKINEGKRRRGNLIDILTNNMMGFMIETMAVDPTDPVEVASIIDQGKDFMKHYQVEISAFVTEGHVSLKDALNTDANDGTNGTPDHTWLDNLPASLGGSTSIRTYAVNELTL